MYALVEILGKQYRAEEGQVLQVDLLNQEEGSSVAGLSSSEQALVLEWKGPSPQAQGKSPRSHVPSSHHRCEPPQVHQQSSRHL